jgi:hypothetical protein
VVLEDTEAGQGSEMGIENTNGRKKRERERKALFWHGNPGCEGCGEGKWLRVRDDQLEEVSEMFGFVCERLL